MGGVDGTKLPLFASYHEKSATKNNENGKLNNSHVEAWRCGPPNNVFLASMDIKTAFDEARDEGTSQKLWSAAIPMVLCRLF